MSNSRKACGISSKDNSIIFYSQFINEEIFVDYGKKKKKKMLDSLNITVYDSNILCRVSSDPINLSCLSVELDLQNEDELCLVCGNRR